MAITFNTGSTALQGGTGFTSFTMSVPSGTLVNDVMISTLHWWASVNSAPTFSVSGPGGAWTQIGTNQLSTDSSANWVYGSTWYRVATSSDTAGTITLSQGGIPAATSGSAATAVATYTGASVTTPIDVSGGTAITGLSSAAVTCPTLTTTKAGDWAVYALDCFYGVGATITLPGGTTQREKANAGSGQIALICDSNGTVGSSGTVIGGGTFSNSNGAGSTYAAAFTIGLEPVPSTASSSTIRPYTPVHVFVPAGR